MQKINNVISKSFYEKVREVAFKDPNNIKWQLVYETTYGYVLRFEKEWITELFSENDVRRIRGDTPVFLVSQTGTGKTTFIFERCLRVAESEGKKVLYLCGRVALERQVKEIAMNHKLNSTVKINGVPVGAMKEYYTDKGIKVQHNFGLIDIFTYQEFLYRNDIKWEEYAAVILDEAHFFISDATFNSYTEEIIDKIVDTFQFTRRIYLTATPEECMDVIYEKESRYLERSSYSYNLNYERPTGMYIYLVDQDYSYLNPFFFTKQNEIVKKIRETPDTVRWFIFIRSKDAGNRLLQELGIPKNEVTYYDADIARETNSSYQELICSEELKTRVTISTKVLDVGINVKTENLNLVLFEDNAVELKQMVGRKRIRKGEKVDAFFYVPSLEEMKRRLGQTMQRIQEENEIVEKINHSHYLKPEHPVLITRDGVEVNQLSKRKLEHDRNYYEKLIEAMSDTKENEKIEYAKWILSIFNILYNEAMFLEDVSDNENFSRLKSVMKPWIGRNFEKEELEQLSREIKGVIGDIREDVRPDRGEMKLNSLNKALKSYGYTIGSIGAKKYRIRSIKGEKEDV